MVGISVIVCTHNPVPDYLRRVLDALRAQILAKEEWKLLLIDNASNTPSAATTVLSGHPQGRHIREDELGLTPARLRGIRESGGDLLVYVDGAGSHSGRRVAEALANKGPCQQE